MIYDNDCGNEIGLMIAQLIKCFLFTIARSCFFAVMVMVRNAMLS